MTIEGVRIIALDLAMGSTGVVAGGREVDHISTMTTDGKGVYRLAGLRHSFDRLLDSTKPELAVMESSVFRSQAAFVLGQAHAVVGLCLLDRGIPIAQAAPKAIKLFATGVGNASKSAMLAAAIRKFEYAGDSEDEADALCLYHLARYALGVSEHRKTHARDRAVVAMDLSGWQGAVPLPVLPTQKRARKKKRQMDE